MKIASLFYAICLVCAMSLAVCNPVQSQVVAGHPDGEIVDQGDHDCESGDCFHVDEVGCDRVTTATNSDCGKPKPPFGQPNGPLSCPHDFMQEISGTVNRAVEDSAIAGRQCERQVKRRRPNSNVQTLSVVQCMRQFSCDRKNEPDDEGGTRVTCVKGAEDATFTGGTIAEEEVHGKKCGGNGGGVGIGIGP